MLNETEYLWVGPKPPHMISMPVDHLPIKNFNDDWLNKLYRFKTVKKRLLNYKHLIFYNPPSPSIFKAAYLTPFHRVYLCLDKLTPFALRPHNFHVDHVMITDTLKKRIQANVESYLDWRKFSYIDVVDDIFKTLVLGELPPINQPFKMTKDQKPFFYVPLDKGVEPVDFTLFFSKDPESDRHLWSLNQPISFNKIIDNLIPCIHRIVIHNPDLYHHYTFDKMTAQSFLNFATYDHYKGRFAYARSSY
jgi:hypothetical protein